METTPMSVRRLSLVALACVGIFGLTACGGGGGAPATPDAYVVSIGISEPKHLVPSNTAEVSGGMVLDAIYTPLVDYDKDFRPVDLAGIVTTNDNKVWTIKIRAGWTFHNGENVTADSYINAWNAGAYGPNAQDSNYFYDKILG